MLMAIVLPGIIWSMDRLNQQSSWFAHLVGGLAMMAVPVLWVIGNLFLA